MYWSLLCILITANFLLCLSDSTSSCSDPNAVSYEGCDISCPPTCEYPRPEACGDVCGPGCKCVDGYILDKSGGKCVKISYCSENKISCNGDPNAVAVSCATTCPATCKSSVSRRKRAAQACLSCYTLGCVCKKGYILSADTGKCIPQSECDKIGLL